MRERRFRGVLGERDYLSLSPWPLLIILFLSLGFDHGGRLFPLMARSDAEKKTSHCGTKYHVVQNRVFGFRRYTSSV